MPMPLFACITTMAIPTTNICLFRESDKVAKRFYFRPCVFDFARTCSASFHLCQNSRKSPQYVNKKNHVPCHATPVDATRKPCSCPLYGRIRVLPPRCRQIQSTVGICGMIWAEMCKISHGRAKCGKIRVNLQSYLRFWGLKRPARGAFL